MPIGPFENAVSDWVESRPPFGGGPQTDSRSLTCFVEQGEALLRVLPSKPLRSEGESIVAAVIHSTCRLSRRRFLTQHTEWLYSALTSHHVAHINLRELAYDAAEYCPGLTPSSAQIDEERTRTQGDKEGYEIDQGLFFHALLLSPKVGAHLIQTSLLPTKRALELLAKFRSVLRIDLGTVLIERRGCAAHLTIKNNDCLNAEDDYLVDDLETAVDLALLDPEVTVGVLRGGVMTHKQYLGRRVFSAGINLKALHSGQISFVDFLLRRELGYINKIFRGLAQDYRPFEEITSISAINEISKPWIAAVDSFAIGGGAQMLLVFDRIIAASDSYFSLPAAQEGIVPGFANLRLQRFLGGRKARQVILAGRRISATDPDAHLLFDEIVDPLHVDAAIDRAVDQFNCPAVVANRRMLNSAEEPIELLLRYASEFSLVQSERIYSPDVLGKKWK